MDEMTLGVATLMAAVIAALGAVAAAIASWRLEGKLVKIETQRHQNELERRQRAILVVRTGLSPQGHGDAAILHNRGEAPARDVGLTLTGLDGDPVPMAIDPERELPIAAIDPGGDYSVPVITAINDLPFFYAEMTWTDDAGDHNLRTQLRL